MKQKLALAIAVVTVFVLGLSITPALAGGSDFGEMFRIESIYTGLLPIMVAIGLILFIINRVVQGLLGESELIKL